MNGELSFLLDSIQRPYSFQGGIDELFTRFINNHNAQVEEEKRFEIGEITVTDPNNYINRENSNYSNTWEAINEKLIRSHGGYLKTRKANGKKYIDYVQSYNSINTQVIEFGENLLDITQYIKGEDVKTALIPIGKDKITINSVNNNKDYIYDETAVKLFGWIWHVQEWEDVTLPQNLIRKGREYLDSVINLSITLEISAVDLHYLNVEIERIKVGDMIRVVSLPHKLDRYFLVSKMAIDLSDPKSSTLILGQTFKTLTEKQNMQNKNVQIAVESANFENVAIKNDVNQLKENIRKIDNVVVEIPTEYVKTETFNNYKEQVKQDYYKKENIYTKEEIKQNYYIKEKTYSKEEIDLKNSEIIQRLEILEGGANT